MAADLLGTETPRLFTPPARPLTTQTSAGENFIGFAEDVLGLTLLPWQKWLARHALELRDDGNFRFRSVLVLVARQNGKSTFLQALTLWRMWVDRIPMTLVAAQSLEKAEEVWAGAVEMAEASPELAASMEPPIMAAGKKELRTTFGSRCKVQTANRKGGRSLSADLVLLDELREHSTWDAWAALTKTTMARPNPQTWATTNAGDDLSVVLNDLRDTALAQINDPDTPLAIFEWSAAPGCSLDDPVAWAQANPSLGHTISADAIAANRNTDPEAVFRTEVLCQRVQQMSEAAIPLWPQRADSNSKLTPGDPVAFAVDVSWDRSTAWIAAVGQRRDGMLHAEIVATGEGTDWIEDRLAQLRGRWAPRGVGVQGNGAPASSLRIEDVTALSGSDLAKAHGALFDAVGTGRLVHPDQDPLSEAARQGAIRAFGDGWLFDRKKSPADVSPLIAVAEALWVLTIAPPPKRRTGLKRIR